MIIEDNIKNLVDIGTPSYIFDLNILKENIRCMRENIQRDTSICYAMKANPFVFIGRHLLLRLFYIIEFNCDDH